MLARNDKVLCIVAVGLFALAAALLLFFLLSLGNAKKEREEYAVIQDTYAGSDTTALVFSSLSEDEPESSLPRVQADFEGLRALNEDTIGWIYIPGTPISYPVMQAKDNGYYLDHSSTGGKSRSGAVFLDAGNSISPLDSNTILYGHNMGEGREEEMFGPLLLYKEESHCKAHPYIQFDTHRENHGWWEIFAVLHLDLRDRDFNYLMQAFPTEANFAAWLEQAQALSLYDTGAAVSTDDRILTLSTCDRSQYRRHGRFVVMAVWRGDG